METPPKRGGTLLGLQMRRRYILANLKTLGLESATAAPTGRRKTMIRHEETQMAAQLRKLYDELRSEGRREGRRSLLRQLAIRKFGPDMAGELSRLLDELTDPDRVEALGSAIIECETGAEFLARVRAE